MRTRAVQMRTRSALLIAHAARQKAVAELGEAILASSVATDGWPAELVAKLEAAKVAATDCRAASDSVASHGRRW